MKKLLLAIITMASVNGFAQGRITGPTDPGKRCSNEPMPADTCEEMRVKAAEIGCITPEELGALRKYGSFPSCNFLKPRAGDPPSKMLDGWCSCGCFAPWTKIMVTPSGDDYLSELLQKRAGLISKRDQFDLVTLSERATLVNLEKDKAPIRIVTKGKENKGLVKIVTTDKRVLFVTEKHPVLTAEGKMVLAKNLRPTDHLVDESGSHLGIRSLSSIPYHGEVYNFATEVTNDDKNRHVIFAEGLAVGDLYWQASLEDQINQVFIRQ